MNGVREEAGGAAVDCGACRVGDGVGVTERVMWFGSRQKKSPLTVTSGERT